MGSYCLTVVKSERNERRKRKNGRLREPRPGRGIGWKEPTLIMGTRMICPLQNIEWLRRTTVASDRPWWCRGRGRNERSSWGVIASTRTLARGCRLATAIPSGSPVRTTMTCWYAGYAGCSGGLEGDRHDGGDGGERSGDVVWHTSGASISTTVGAPLGSTAA